MKLTKVILLVAVFILTVGCGVKHDTLSSSDIEKLREQYPLCSRPYLLGASTSIGSAGIDTYFKHENNNYDDIFSVVQFIEDKGTEEYVIKMKAGTPEYEVNKQQGTGTSTSLDMCLLSVKINGLICGDLKELPERIYNENDYATLVYNTLIIDTLLEFKEGDRYVMLLGILREDTEIRDKYINCPEIFAAKKAKAQEWP